MRGREEAHEAGRPVEVKHGQYRAGQLQPKVRIRNFISKMACPGVVLEPLTEAEHDDMVALIQRAHHHGQLGLQSPPAKKKQNRAASPTPVTTGKKATRRRDELGDRAHEIYLLRQRLAEGPVLRQEAAASVHREVREVLCRKGVGRCYGSVG